MSWQIIRQHEESQDCWCEPRLVMVDGEAAFVHTGCIISDEEVREKVRAAIDSQEGDEE